MTDDGELFAAGRLAALPRDICDLIRPLLGEPMLAALSSSSIDEEDVEEAHRQPYLGTIRDGVVHLAPVGIRGKYDGLVVANNTPLVRCEDGAYISLTKKPAPYLQGADGVYEDCYLLADMVVPFRAPRHFGTPSRIWEKREPIYTLPLISSLGDQWAYTSGTSITVGNPDAGWQTLLVKDVSAKRLPLVHVAWGVSFLSPQVLAYCYPSKNCKFIESLDLRSGTCTSMRIVAQD